MEVLNEDNDELSFESDLGQFQDENVLEVGDEDEVLPFWKRIFHLPFEPVWSYTVLLLAISNIYISIYNSRFAEYQKQYAPTAEFTMVSDVFYIIDIVIVIIGKRIRNLHVSPTELHLPNWIILCDTISVVPLELLVPTSNETRFTAKLYYTIQVLDCLKIARIYYIFYYHRNRVGNSKIFLQFCEILFNMGFAIAIGFVITYETTCPLMECTIPLSWDVAMDILCITISFVTGSGNISAPYDVMGTFYYAILSLIFYFTISCVSVCYVTIELFSRYQNTSIFLAKINSMNENAMSLNVPTDLVRQSQDYYSTLLKKRKGHLDNLNDFVDLPPALCQQVGLDFCLSLFKHSSLFRQYDLPFLRYLSYFMESKIMLPGDTVYEHQSVKSTLVYVVSGVIQILTEEDGATPILSFSSGTYLGELGLFVSYKSRVRVSCKTHCNLLVLSKKHFVQAVLKAYPERYREMRKTILKRISDTRQFCAISQHFNAADELNNKTDLITIMWLKSSLHRLMIKDLATSSKHECQNIFLRSEFGKDRFKNKFFVPDYLDTLAIAERVELVTDSVFLRTTCPCIFQANSIILQFWNSIVLFLSIVAGFVVPFYAFVIRDSPTLYISFIHVITLFWWLDLYVQISTAIITSYEIVCTINDIFYYRISTIGFIIDIVSAIPLNLFSCVLVSTSADQNKALLHLNRILKIYRIERLFQRLDASSNEIIANNYLKFLCYFIYLSYIFTCILHAHRCNDGSCDSYTIFVVFVWNFFIVVQNLTLTSMLCKYSVFTDYTYIFIFLTIFSLFIYILSNAYISAMHVLQRLNKIILLDTIVDIFSIIDYNKLTLKYKNKILSYIETQWCDNKANKLLYNTSAFNELPLDLYMYVKEATYRETLRKMPLFANFPAEVIADISVIARSYLLPPNQVLYYRGEIPDYFYILDRGYCKVVQNITNRSTKSLGPPEGIAVMEACLRMPIINTIVTATHCKSLRIHFPELMHLLLRYPECKEHIENTVNKIRQIDSTLFQEHVILTNIVTIEEFDPDESFRKFDYNPKLNSLDQRNYDKPFEQLTFLYFVKNFLMRTTILPHGNFLFYWECIRCVCAFFSAILFTDNEISLCINCVWFIVLIILDIMAWIDIYLRLHIAYFNKRNCLVTHPLKTAVYYLQHSFIVDLLAVFPFGFITFFIISGKYYKLQSTLQMNRVLQLHRFIAFFRHLDKTILKHTKVLFVVVEFLPLLIVACIVSGTLIRAVLCDISNDIVHDDDPYLTDGIQCDSSWINFNFFTKPLSPNQVRLYSIYIATTIFTQAGMTGFTLFNESMAMAIIPITILSYILSTHIIAKTIAQFTNADSIRVSYQDSLKSIHKFLDQYRVDPDLAKQLILHYELKWSRRKGKNIHELLKHFHDALKQDILYDIYGVILEKVSAFSMDNKAFLRSILLAVDHDVALKNTFICKINDITTNIYFIYKGQVDVIAADGTILNSLGPGSMFGTLDNCKISRQTVSILATVHTDILTIQNITFYSIIKKYPNIQQHFRSLIAFHVDFLKGSGTLNAEQEVPNFKNDFNVFKNPINYIKAIVFNPDGSFIEIWKMFILLIISTLEVHLTLYQIAVKEFNSGLVLFQYTCDVFHFIHLFISLHTAYENKDGVIIVDLDMIQLNFRKEKIKYYLQIISIVPLDIFVWLLPDAWFYTLYPILRFNRLLRFCYIIMYFREQQQKINCKLYVRYLYIILLTMLILQIFTCAIIRIGCSYEKNMSPPMNCNFQSISSYEKLLVYLTYYNVISLIYSVSYQNDVFPDSEHLTIYIILFMIVLNLVRVVLAAQIYIIVQMTFTQLYKFNMYISRVKHFLEYQRVSLHLVKKTTRFLVLLWQYHRGAAFPVLLQEAPKLLQEQILNSAFSYHVDQHVIFKTCHKDFNRQLISYLRNSTYFRHDYIVLEGCIDQCMYFIHSGVVLVLSIDDSHRETKVATLIGGSSFGILQGLNPHKPHTYSYRSTTNTVILTLKYSTWEHLLKFFPASLETINERKSEYVDITPSTAL